MDLYLILPLAQTTIYLALVFSVLHANTKSQLHRIFALFLASMATWGVVIFIMRASPDIESAYFWERVLQPIGAFGAVALYHFSVYYATGRANSWFISILYLTVILLIPPTVTGLVIDGMQMKPYGYAPTLGPLFPLQLLLTVGLSIAALATFIRKYWLSDSPEQRNRILYIILGIGISLIGGIFDILPIFGLPLYPGLIIGNIVFGVLTTGAILKHNLLDIRVVIRRGVAYFLTSALFAIPILTPFILWVYFYPRATVLSWVYFVALILFALLVPSVWRILERQVDRWFYRDRYNYLSMLQTMSLDTPRLSDYHSLASRIVELIAGALGCSSVYLLLPTSFEGDFRVVSSSGAELVSNRFTIESHRPFANWLRNSGEILSYRDLSAIPQLQALTYDEKELLEQANTELIVPLTINKGYLGGLLILGRKLSRQSYNVEEKDILRAVASHIAVKLDNMRLYQEAVTAEKDLRKWLNCMSDCIIISSASDHTMQFLNETAINKFGRSHSETCWGCLGKDAPCLNCPIEQHLALDSLTLPHFIGQPQLEFSHYFP